MKVYTIYKSTNNINGKIYIGFDSNWPRRMREHKSSASNIKHKEHNSVFHKATRKYGFENFSWEILYQSFYREYTLNEMEPYFIKEHNSTKCGYNCTGGGDGTFGYILPIEKRKNINLTIYTFYHPTHGNFVGKRLDLINKYGLESSWVSRLISGKSLSCKGWKLLDASGSISHREDMRGKYASNKGNKGNPNPRSEETKKKISESLKGKTPHNKGKKMSKEFCLNMSEARKGIKK